MIIAGALVVGLVFWVGLWMSTPLLFAVCVSASIASIVTGLCVIAENTEKDEK